MFFESKKLVKMQKNYLAITEKIEKGKVVHIVNANSSSSFPSWYGCIKPLDDAAVKCLIDQFVTKHKLTTDDINIGNDSQLEFSGKHLPQHLKLDFGSQLSLGADAIIDAVDIIESKVSLSGNTKIGNSSINRSEIYMDDNSKILECDILESNLNLKGNDCFDDSDKSANAMKTDISYLSFNTN